MTEPRTLLSDLYRDLPKPQKTSLRKRFVDFSGCTVRTLTNYLTKYPPKAIVPFFEREMGKPADQLWTSI